jgi:hypothetical protein
MYTSVIPGNRWPTSHFQPMPVAVLGDVGANELWPIRLIMANEFSNALGTDA